VWAASSSSFTCRNLCCFFLGSLNCPRKRSLPKLSRPLHLINTIDLSLAAPYFFSPVLKQINFSFPPPFRCNYVVTTPLVPSPNQAFLTNQSLLVPVVTSDGLTPLSRCSHFLFFFPCQLLIHFFFFFFFFFFWVCFCFFFVVLVLVFFFLCFFFGVFFFGSPGLFSVPCVSPPPPRSQA